MTNRICLPLLLCIAAPLAGFTQCGGTEPVTPLPPPPPDPSACADLDEDACVAAADRCEAVYVGDCACSAIACLPDESCPPCECLPNQVTFVGCQDRDPCAALDEASCIASPGCEPAYGSTCDPSTGDRKAPDTLYCPEEECGAPPPCDAEVTFLGCYTRPEQCPEVLCDIYCEYGHQLDANGCAICACNPPPSGCDGLSEEQCLSTKGCAPIYNGGAAPCACPGCDPSSGVPCEPCTCEGDRIAPPPDEYAGCVAIEEPCANLSEGECSVSWTCHPEYSQPRCLAAPPCEGDGCGEQCPPPSYIGCYPNGPPPPPPPSCQSDADCPGGYCEVYATCAAIGCPPPPPPQCVYPRCDDGSAPVCAMPSPVCAPGEVAAVRNGCYECVDARTCQ
ncbi:MAG: hypothetical protein IT384_29625 [Deltaproteobacteria bacterium]|nr:hypothetical protein [Deltaproteobacteria bacterium]